MTTNVNYQLLIEFETPTPKKVWRLIGFVRTRGMHKYDTLAAERAAKIIEEEIQRFPHGTGEIKYKPTLFKLEEVPLLPLKQ